MKKSTTFLLFVLLFYGCGDSGRIGYHYDKAYEYVVVNDLADETVKIVPMAANEDFWVAGGDEYVILPMDKAIIGTKLITEHAKKRVKDIYNMDDIIAVFRVNINDIELNKDLTRRTSWSFVAENGKGTYTLTINQATIK